MLTSRQIRQQFLDYFVQRHAHTFVPSSPVVPHADPTLLFANAGMNQFKDVFLGTGARDYSRAVNTQKCIRAGGKHNDLEDVGKDTYHHTFFEMLGNWSFGDYFKNEAIDWAWDLLVKVWKLDPSRLYTTYFEGSPADGLEVDAEARDYWLKHLPADHVLPGNARDNFWEMGDTGPCGPCSEIHYDATPDKTGRGLVNRGDPRVIEIWNLVFIQFNRDAGGHLTPLPARHVDTGMGFERVTAVLQGKSSNYDTDIFTPLFEAIREVTGARPYAGKLDDSPEGRIDMAYRVIADHIRCLTFALTDGAVPSNEGRGYVLRRILRRAVRHGRQTLGVSEPFMHKLVPAVVDAMGDAFPELKKNPAQVAELIRDEEVTFGRTLDRGIELFEEAATVAGNQFMVELAGTDEDVRFSEWKHNQLHRLGVGAGTYSTRNFDWRTCPTRRRPEILGEDAFKLHDTYGFPLDLTQVMAEERGMTVDVAGFDRLMEEAREKARAAGGVHEAKDSLAEIVQKLKPPATKFVGYTEQQIKAPTFCLLFEHRRSFFDAVDKVAAGQHVAMVTGVTPFYAEAGGQVGDTGQICNDTGGVMRVEDTIRVGDVFFHLGVIQAGEFATALPSLLGQAGRGARPTTSAPASTVDLSFTVDPVRRSRIMANHTSTHIMNHKLRAVLGEHVMQKGSLVDDEKTRFDFSHNAAVSDEQAERIEKLVNDDIAADLPVYDGVAAQQDALKIKGLRAVFGEKYPPAVRIVSIGAPVDELLAQPQKAEWYEHSVEFCGGTHLAKTGDAEGFVIVSEEAVAKGVRRITAITGHVAHQAAARGEMLLSRLEALKKSTDENLADAVARLAQDMGDITLPMLTKSKLRDGIAELQKTIKQQQKQKSKAAAGDIVDTARAIADASNGQNIIVEAIEGADGELLRTAMDVIRKKRPDAALLLGAASDDKCAFVAAVPPGLIAPGLKAGDWVREVAKVAGGGGGGRPDMAQAGGKDPAKLDEALAAGRKFAASKL